MPIARIRTLDPEAISFLAARLAASGFQLKFSAPNETDLDDADLEIIVTRMDSATALQQARIQAEEMGVDVTVMPGALDASTSLPTPSLEQPAAPVLDETPAQETFADHYAPASTPVHPARWTTPYHADVPEDANEFVSAGVPDPDETQGIEPPRTSAADVISSRLKQSAESLAAFTQSSATRLSDWNRRTAEARAQRRAERERTAEVERENRERLEREAEERRLLEVPSTPPAAPASDEVTASKLRLVSPPRTSRRLSHRDQNYRRAAVIAAILLLAIMLGWGVIGMRSPANPIGNSNLSNVQQQTPFGAASVSAPVQTAAPNLRPAAIPHPAVHTTRHKPTPTHHTRTSNLRHHTARSSSDDGEVVVRHFGTKPVAQQAKAKTKDGVKVISEE
jgi:hypothetical protein